MSAAAAGIPTLVGTRCTLRALRPDDAPAIARHADDEGVWQNLFDGFPHPYTLAIAQTWCSTEHRLPAYGTVWAIDRGGEAVGCCSLRQDSGWLRCSAEVGYWVGRAHWGCGIASQSLALMTAWAWAEGPAELTRLYAPIFGFNAGSQAVARRAGYVLEGVLAKSAIKAGRVIDRALYATYRP